MNVWMSVNVSVCLCVCERFFLRIGINEAVYVINTNAIYTKGYMTTTQLSSYFHPFQSLWQFLILLICLFRCLCIARCHFQLSFSVPYSVFVCINTKKLMIFFCGNVLTTANKTTHNGHHWLIPTGQSSNRSRLR